jgi:PEP-CTERM motif
MRAIAYGASTLALMALAAPAAADTVPFVDITPGPTTFTAPETGVYDILAFGAQGGTGDSGAGGLGAEVGGDFELTKGEVLSIVVGGQGGAGIAGGGGGGTFVVSDLTRAILIGGGGGGTAGGGFGVGGPGLMSGGGGGSRGVGGGLGGADGSGGRTGLSRGGGAGGGLNSAGASASGGGGGGAAAGGAGGAGRNGGSVGGVGGGGGGGGGFVLAGGGGGGFSGGGGGGAGGGGGGGSLNDAFANLIGFDGVRSGNGELEIDFVAPAVPEPSTWAMLLLGFAGLGALAYRRNRSGRRPAKA